MSKQWLHLVGVSFVVLPLIAQVPERLRLDLSAGLLFAPDSRGFLIGDLAPRAGQVGPSPAIGLFDLAATLNITQKLALSAGVPFGLTARLNPADRLDWVAGRGDAHAAIAFGLVPERRRSPGISIQAEGGAPTASLPFLGSQLWRVTGRSVLYKSLHPRFSLSADASYSHFARKSYLRGEPIRSFGAGLGIGITRASILNLQVEHLYGGKRVAAGKVAVPYTRDLHAGLGITRYSRGRPRFTLLVSAGGLPRDPVLVLGFRFALLSLGKTRAAGRN
jgi:hypothetical protein